MLSSETESVAINWCETCGDPNTSGRCRHCEGQRKAQLSPVKTQSAPGQLQSVDIKRSSSSVRSLGSGDDSLDQLTTDIQQQTQVSRGVSTLPLSINVNQPMDDSAVVLGTAIQSRFDQHSPSAPLILDSPPKPAWHQNRLTKDSSLAARFADQHRRQTGNLKASRLETSSLQTDYMVRPATAVPPPSPVSGTNRSYTDHLRTALQSVTHAQSTVLSQSRFERKLNPLDRLYLARREHLTADDVFDLWEASSALWDRVTVGCKSNELSSADRYAVSLLAKRWPTSNWATIQL